MGVLAKWNKKSFEISPNKITPLYNLTTAYKLKSNANNDTSGTPPTNTRGRELETVKFSVKYIAGTGINVRNEFGAWRNLVGIVDTFYVGGKQFGPPKWQLESAEISETLLDGKGGFLQAVVSITLVEFVSSTDKKSTITTTAKSSGTASSKQAAVSAKASANDKALKNPYGTGGKSKGAVK